MDQERKRERSEENTLLDTSVLLSGRRGITTIFSIVEFPIAMEECIILYPEALDFELAIHIATALRKKGRPIGTIDVLIASISINRGYTLLTKDKDFATIQSIIPEFSFELYK